MTTPEGFLMEEGFEEEAPAPGTPAPAPVEPAEPMPTAPAEVSDTT